VGRLRKKCPHFLSLLSAAIHLSSSSSASFLHSLLHRPPLRLLPRARGETASRMARKAEQMEVLCSLIEQRHTQVKAMGGEGHVLQQLRQAWPQRGLLQLAVSRRGVAQFLPRLQEGRVYGRDLLEIAPRAEGKLPSGAEGEAEEVEVP
jgi:hypothetical protein